MEEVNMVAEAVKFMILGMGIVFVFLTIMVFALQLQAKLIAKYFPDEKTSAKTPTKKQQSENKDDDKTLTAAITAAILHHNYLKVKGE